MGVRCGQTPSFSEMTQLRKSNHRRKHLVADEIRTREVGWRVGMVGCTSDSLGPGGYQITVWLLVWLFTLQAAAIYLKFCVPC